MNNTCMKGVAIFFLAFAFLGDAQAVNCTKNPAHRDCTTPDLTVTFTGEVHTFITDRVNEKFIVTGTGMDTATSATLGNNPASISFQDPTTLEMPFSPATAFPVAGNVEFSLDGNFISLVYLDGPIIAPSTSCPCQGVWDDNLGAGTGSCAEVTDGTQVSLSSYIDNGVSTFFISTAFDPGPENATNSFCAIVEVDPATLELLPGGVSQQTPVGSSGYNNCYDYMVTDKPFCSEITTYP